MKVLHVLNSSRFSGAENLVCQIIDMFDNDKSIDMAYCSPFGDIAKTLAERNIQYYPVKKLSKKNLKHVINEFKPDIIHAHDMRASYIVSTVCNKIPYISHIHNNAFDSRKLSIKSIIYFFASKKARHIFWVSDDAMYGFRFIKSLVKKSSVLQNVIDAKRIYIKSDEDINDYNYDVIFLGRLTYPKNPQRMLNVIAKAVKISPDVRVAIVGTGELESEVKELAKQLMLQKHVDFLGYQPNPYKILKNSKMLLLTSRWEGLPMCVLEAMAFKLPVISTPVDGVRGILVDGFTGFISDNDDELAKRISQIARDNNLLEELKSNIEKEFEKINDIEAYRCALINVYKNTLGI